MRCCLSFTRAISVFCRSHIESPSVLNDTNLLLNPSLPEVKVGILSVSSQPGLPGIVLFFYFSLIFLFLHPSQLIPNAWDFSGYSTKIPASLETSPWDAKNPSPRPPPADMESWEKSIQLLYQPPNRMKNNIVFSVKQMWYKLSILHSCCHKAPLDSTQDEQCFNRVTMTQPSQT